MPAGAVPMPAEAENRALGILLGDTRSGRPVHVEHIPARAGSEVPWPPWVPAEIVGAFTAGLVLEQGHWRAFVERGARGLDQLSQPSGNAGLEAVV